MGRHLGSIARLLFLWILVVTSSVYAEEWIIKDIRLEGLQRVSASAVFAELPMGVGDKINEPLIAEAIRKLFRTGLFEDIRMEADKGVVIIRLKEYATISKIEIEGNKVIKTKDLLEILRKNELSEGQIFRPDVFEAMKLSLLREYVAQGRYSAVVEAKLTELPRHRVAINIDINEGKKAAIKHIYMVGNHNFSQRKLLKLFELETTNWLSWLNNKDKYSQTKLAGDIERLQSFYLNLGYLNFSIDSVQVSISANKRSIYIAINMTEGDIYQIGNIDIIGKLTVPKEQLESLLEVRAGDVYSQEKVNASKEKMLELLADEGYAFAEINVFNQADEVIVLSVDESKHVVNLTFAIDPKRKVYVNRIEFRGNAITADEVLRREMRQLEGASVSNKKIELGKLRLERLGFFSNIEVETLPVLGTEDQLDVIYNVEEKKSGNISASVGYSQQGGLLFSASLQENNFFGSGNSVGFNAQRSRYQTSYGISYNDPYFTVDGVSVGARLYHRSTDYSEINIASFNTDITGFGVNFGYPLSEVSSINYGFSYEYLNLETGSFAPEEIRVLDRFGEQFNNYKFALFWRQQALNRGILPTAGYSQQFGGDIAFPWSDLTFYKIGYTGQLFIPLVKDFVLRLRTNLGYGGGYGDLARLPFLENYYAGGLGSVRGFETNTLGPRETPIASPLVTNGIQSFNFNNGRNANPIGGNILITGTVELILPIPFLRDNDSVQTSVFFDYGNVFDSQCTRVTESVLSNGVSVPAHRQSNCSKPAFDELRYSTGLAVTWISGFGPLSFSLGKAFNGAGSINNGLFAVRPEEDEFFQFSIGQTF